MRGTSNGTSITYVGANTFKVGQVISVTGFTSGAYNVTNQTIVSATSNQFVVNTAIAVGSSTGTGIATLGSAQVLSALQPFLQSGVANLRPTDYIDVVCSQLTVNQQLRDSSSSPVSRDMIARIYLDESVPSRVISNTFQYNYPSDTLPNPIATGLTGAVINGGSNVVTLTVGDTSNLLVGRKVRITGVTTTTQLSGTAQVIQVTNPTTLVVAYPYPIATGTPGFSGALVTAFNPIESVLESQEVWDDDVNGVTPFVIYRQFQNPKQIRWSGKMPFGNLTFELYDDQGRSIQDLWSSAYPITDADPYNTGRGYANGTIWNCMLQVSED
jgi:hypothetical protein